MLTLSPLKDGHIQHLVDNLSAADAIELQDAGIEAGYAFAQGVKTSLFVESVVKGDEPVAIFGLAPDPSNKQAGIPWVLVTEEFRRHPRASLDLSRQVLDRMQQSYSYLHNIVHAKHEIAIRWLKWCGFVIEDGKPLGPNNAFYYFHWSK